MEYSGCWTYEGKCLNEIPQGYYGFVYKINLEGRMYIGKKSFYKTRKTKISKKRRTLENTKKRIEKVTLESDWKTYYGSNEEINEKISKNPKLKNSCERIILKLCKTKIDLTYWETYYLFVEEVLLNDLYYNGNILGKFYKGRIQK